jgi:hypothetical protein
MNVRELIMRNPGWKLLSLMLAILVYVFMQAQMEGDLFLLQRTTEVVFERTVSVLASADLEGVFRVEPRVVRVKVIGRRDTVARLTESDIRVYVDMTDVVAATAVRRTVHILRLDDVARIEIEPDTVRAAYEPAASPNDRSNSK